ncbi:MAG: hypothetical protein U0T83_08100 [Bacteriovoracaceae bacterium]
MVRLFFFLQIFISSNLLALTQSFIVRNISVQIKIPEDWKFTENFLDVPLTITGPKKDGFNPYIGIIDSGDLEKMIYPSKIEEVLTETANTEIDNLKKANYLDPQITLVGKSEKKEDALLYQIKLEYGMNQYRYYETIYYLYCNKGYLSLYTRVRSDHKEYEDTIYEILDNIKCL